MISDEVISHWMSLFSYASVAEVEIPIANCKWIARGRNKLNCWGRYICNVSELWQRLVSVCLL